METNRRNDKPKKQKDPTPNLDDLLNSSRDPKEVQSNELEVIKAICQTDFEMVTKNKFTIIVKPFPDEEEENFVACKMAVTFHSMYPFVEPPIIKILQIKDQNIGGLSEKQLSELQKMVTDRAKELVGQEMIYMILTEVQEYLQKNNKQQMSFYDEMMQNQKKVQKEEEDKLQKEQEREGRKGQEELDRLIEEELNRQKLLPRPASMLESSTDESADDSWKFLSDDKFRGGIGSREMLNFSTNELSKYLKSPPLSAVAAPFRWEKKIDFGKGAYGDIYSAENKTSNTQMFVKEVKVFINDTDYEDKKDIIRHLMDVIGRIKSLSHENIVPYLGCELSTESDFVVFRIFQEHIQHDVTGVKIDWDENVLRRIVLQIISGLHYLHTHDVPHKDLQASNILFDNNGRARLSDFFISPDLRRLIDEEPEQEPVLDIRFSGSENLGLGSFGEEENPKDELVQHKNRDIWALGRTLLNMAEGNAFTARRLPEELSREGKDFLQMCLRRHHKATPDVAALIQHPWLRDVSATFQEFIPKSPPPSPYPIPNSTNNLNANLNNNLNNNTPLDDDISTVSELSSRINESGDTAIGFPHSDAWSRYRNDFDEEEVLGSGGFGVVVRSRNKLDGRLYAIKKVPLHRHQQLLQKMLREVTTLSRLNHQYVVRYYQAWIEKEDRNHPLKLEDSEDEEDEESYGSEDSLDWSDDDLRRRGKKSSVASSKNSTRNNNNNNKKQKSAASNKAQTGKKCVGCAPRSGQQRPVSTGNAKKKAAASKREVWSSDSDSPTGPLRSRDTSKKMASSPTAKIGTEWSSSDVDSQFSDQDSQSDSSQMSSEEDPEDILNWFEPNNDWGLSAMPKDRFDLADDDSIVFEHTTEGTFGFQDTTLNSSGDLPSGEGKEGKKEQRLILYIQMDYCTKNTLRQSIDEKLLDEDERWRLLREIAEGLAHIHAQGIIHRDLKPANIFLDSSGSVKIGDFGLATTGTQIVEETLKIGKLGSGNRTRLGVGTPFYLAPEQERCGTFDNKIDIYALGIIFFEMVENFSTGMERAQALTALRKELKFPPDFHLKHTNEMELIKWLLKPEPKDRPSCTELLQSSLMPTRMDEELLKSAINNLNPTTTLFSTVIQKLFSLNPDKHFDFTYDYHLSNNMQMAEYQIRYQVFAQIMAIGRQHGAVEIDTPLLIPKNDRYHHDRTASLLDDVGTQLALPYDLLFPFARYIARGKMNNLRRISISRVFRKHDPKGKPREMYEADFDIITPANAAHTATMVCDAEVIKVTCEVLDSFAQQIGQYYLRINNHKLLDAILSVCEVDNKNSNYVRHALNLSLPNSWQRTCKQLQARQIISAECAKSLTLYFHTISGLSLSTAFTKLETLLKRSKAGRDAMQELKHLFKHLKTWGILSKVKLDLGFLLNYTYYDGIVFQAIIDNNQTHPDLIAAGGRYDRLVSQFMSTNTQPISASCGVSIAVEKIVQYSSAFKQKLAKATGVRVPVSDTQILVCSIGRNMMEYRMQVAHRLWEHNLSAEYLHSERLKVEELHIYCKKASIPWIVLLKSTNFLSTETVTLKNVATGAERVVDLDEMCSDLVMELNAGPLGTQRGVTRVSTTIAMSHDALPTSASVLPSVSGASSNLSGNLTGVSGMVNATSSSQGSGVLGSASLRSGGAAQNVGPHAAALPSPHSSVRRHVSWGNSEVSAGAQQTSPMVGPAASGGGASAASLKVPPNVTTASTNINVVVLTTDAMQSKLKKKIAQSATQRILPNLKRFATTAVIKVAAIDFSTSVLKEIHANYDYHTGHVKVQPRNSRYREKLGLLQDFFNKEKQSPSPFCYVYSYQEDSFEIFLL